MRNCNCIIVFQSTKPKWLSISNSNKECCELKIRQQTIKQVDSFNYLCSFITTDKRIKKEIKKKQDNVHTSTETVQCISTVYVRINIISELFRLEKKIKQFNFKLYSSNDPFILLYFLTKQ